MKNLEELVQRFIDSSSPEEMMAKLNEGNRPIYQKIETGILTAPSFEKICKQLTTTMTFQGYVQESFPPVDFLPTIPKSPTVPLLLDIETGELALAA